ncbi:hypothetical protein L596_026469 [Steinernema carpocapsae]|uniref:Uncharacterized protein n=1 Tax=Steinernema carpocapsae TaxID=34508 RepID=A0A4U5M1J0_STECR|nr:hypothetical protein L596_026469 [Steinernema carpocapsae]
MLREFPSEAARFKGLAPILHVDGCTEHQGAHITYITEVEREKLLNGDNDDEPTPHNRSKTSQGNSFEQQGNKKLSAADNVEQGDADDAVK